jgi:polysaccharide biosynthesis/export protein VpsN
MNSSVTKLRLLLCLAAASVVAVLTGCQTPQYAFQEVPPGGSTNSPPALSTASPVNALTATNKQRSPTPDQLSPGNKIVVTYSGNPNAPLKHEEMVREDGYISPPLLNRPVKASDKTVGELQEELHGLYVPALFKSLTVTVTMEDRFFFVGGEVKSPGQRPYLSEMTTLKAIQSAGDFTEFAKRSRVDIIRANGHKERVNCVKAMTDPTKDLPIFPGDQIIVRKRIF